MPIVELKLMSHLLVHYPIHNTPGNLVVVVPVS